MNRFYVSGVVLVLSMLVIAFQIWAILYLALPMLEIVKTQDQTLQTELRKALLENFKHPSMWVPFLFGSLITLAYPIIVFYKNRYAISSKLLIVVLAVLTYLLNAYLVLAIACLMIWLIQQMRSNATREVV